MSMAFIDLQAQRHRVADRINAAVQAVIEGGQYIMGPQVKAFEAKLAEFCGAKFALGCANGTDALVLALKALDIGQGDAVFCPSFTFTATAEAVVLANATPVFVDIDARTYNIDPAHLAQAVDAIATEGKLKPKCIIAVDLFGQSADYPAIKAIADKNGLKIIADSAQGFGCTLGGAHPIKWADIVTTSFFPAKPLGCYGDGGAVLTNDAALSERMDSLRVHGKAMKSDLGDQVFDHDPKYLNMRVGTNSRLDTLQAAILLEKLAIFADEIELRNKVAARYNEGLAPYVATVPYVIEGGVSTWAQYTLEHEDRDAMAASLKAQGIPSTVYYPVPLHMQPAYRHHPSGPGGMKVTEAKAQVVMSLPMHPYLKIEDQDRVIEAIAQFHQETAARRHA